MSSSNCCDTVNKEQKVENDPIAKFFELSRNIKKDIETTSDDFFHINAHFNDALVHLAMLETTLGEISKSLKESQVDKAQAKKKEIQESVINFCHEINTVIDKYPGITVSYSLHK